MTRRPHRRRRRPRNRRLAAAGGKAGVLEMTAKTPEQRIAQLGLSLPPAAAAVANYVPWVITGNLVMTSGNLPWRDGKLAYVGKIGREISGDDGYKSCQLSCLNALAQIKQAVGELAKVKR